MSGLKYEVREGYNRILRTHSGYKMRTNAEGRRRKTDDVVYKPNGIFHGYVFSETEKSHTGDWGDGNGVVTKVSVERHIIAEVSGNTDRDLVERRTRAVYDALHGWPEAAA